MRFRTSSWHYRLVQWTYGRRYFWRVNRIEHPDYIERNEYRRNISLCKYFWSTVLAVIAIPWSLGWKAAGENVKGVMVIGGFELGYGSFMTTILYHSLGLWAFLVGFSIPAIIIGIMAMFAYLSEKITWSLPERKHPRPQHPKKEKGPSLVGEYLKAKKQKVCPIIQWDET